MHTESLSEQEKLRAAATLNDRLRLLELPCHLSHVSKCPGQVCLMAAEQKLRRSETQCCRSDWTMLTLLCCSCAHLHLQDLDAVRVGCLME